MYILYKLATQKPYYVLGDGEPPDTAQKLWRTLNRKKDSETILEEDLSSLTYTVLGLGDTNYTNFCNFGKNLDEKLHNLGAQRYNLFFFNVANPVLNNVL